MSAFTFLHAADIHLDSPLKGLESYPDAPVEQIRNSSRRALDNLVDLALNEEVAFVLLAGDIFDGSWRDYNTALFFAQRMSRLHQAGIQVFLVTGNHDAASSIRKTLRPPENVRIFPAQAPKSFPIQDLGVLIHGRSYPGRDVSEDLAADYPQANPEWFNIGLLHTSLTGRPGHEPYAPTSEQVLAGKGYDYWALGHVHQREVVSRSPWIVFPGTIQGRHIRETGPKGCTLVQVDEGRVAEAVHHDLDTVRWEHCPVDLTDCPDRDSVWTEVRRAFESALDTAQGRQLAMRLELSGQTGLHPWLHAQPALVREECRNVAAGLSDVWLEKVRITTRPEADTEVSDPSDFPLSGLIDSIQNVHLSNSFLQDIPELRKMRTKLPHQLFHGQDPLNLDDPEQVTRLQEDVRELLLGRLLRRGERS